jgi:hypothetical protein
MNIFLPDLPRISGSTLASRHTLLLRSALDRMHPLGPVGRVQLDIDLVVVQDAGIVERAGLSRY